MLACAAGMSTSLLVTKMEKAADNRGLQADIFALPLTEAEDYALSHPVDVVLLGHRLLINCQHFKKAWPKRTFQLRLYQWLITV